MRTHDLVGDLAVETLVWIGDERKGRDDVYDEVLAFSLATFIEGHAITPLGYDDTHHFAVDGGDSN